MDLSQIREILKIVAESGVAEVEIEEDDFKMVVRLNSPNVSIQPQAPAYPFPQAYYPPPAFPPPAPASYEVTPPSHVQQHAPQAVPPTTPQPAGSPAAVPTEPANMIKAPIVGTFYTASSPESDPFVKVGDKVQVGDVLCIIEAMKLMNEIESEVSGTIKDILIKNAEPVEYDQPLFVIEPD